MDSWWRVRVEPELLLKNLDYGNKPFIVRMGMLESNTLASKIANIFSLQRYSYANRMIYTTGNKNISNDQFKKGILAIGGPDRG